jgi:hypothetical protein
MHKAVLVLSGKSLCMGWESTACEVVTPIKKWLFVQRKYFVSFFKQQNPHAVPSPYPCIKNSLDEPILLLSVFGNTPREEQLYDCNTFFQLLQNVNKIVQRPNRR